MYIERTLEKEIYKYLDSKEIIAVIGPRQSGKTTLLRRIYDRLSGAVYLDFEDKEVLDLFEEDIKEFAQLYVLRNSYLFIDEFHYASEGGRLLKYLYDTYPSIKIIISGSSALDITVRAVKYLVGRIFVFNLYPLSFREYLSYVDPDLYERIYIPLSSKIGKIFEERDVELHPVAKSILTMLSRHYDKFVRFGGYPRVVTAEKEEEKQIVLKNIYNTYFLREIGDVLNLSADRELRRLIKALSLQIGSLVSYHELQQTTGFNYKNLVKYLEVLDKTYVCMQVSPFFTNKRKEIVKAPKIYFYDTGLRNYASGNFAPLSSRVDSGYLNENFIADELLKRNVEFKYWRSKAKAEVDFVIDAEEPIPLEVKSSLNSNRLNKSFMSFIKRYNPKMGFILSMNYMGKTEYNQSKIYFLPLMLI